MDVVKMPRLGVTMKAGKVSKWLKNEGDPISKGELLFELETEKSVIEIESQADGIVRKILIGEDEEVPINTVIAVVAQPDEEIDLSVFLKVEGETLTKSAVSQTESEIEPSSGASKAVKISPRARKMAQDLGVSLENVHGSGPGGLITEEDVLSASQNNQHTLKTRETVVLNHVKQAMSKNMLDSWRNIPQFTQIVSVNMSNVLKVKAEWKGNSISINDILIKAVGTIADRMPIVNSRLEGNQVLVFEEVNISVAVASEHGLVVPVVRNVQSKSVETISKEIKVLVEKTKSNQLNSDDFAHGTITVSNLGSLGIETGTPIINNPQCTLVFAGSIQKTPVVNEFDDIVIAPLMKLSVCFDHRFIDGITAAQFTDALRQHLQNITLDDIT